MEIPIINCSSDRNQFPEISPSKYQTPGLVLQLTLLSSDKPCKFEVLETESNHQH